MLIIIIVIIIIIIEIIDRNFYAVSLTALDCKKKKRKKIVNVTCVVKPFKLTCNPSQPDSHFP